MLHNRTEVISFTLDVSDEYDQVFVTLLATTLEALAADLRRGAAGLDATETLHYGRMEVRCLHFRHDHQTGPQIKTNSPTKEDLLKEFCRLL